MKNHTDLGVQPAFTVYGLGQLAKPCISCMHDDTRQFSTESETRCTALRIGIAIRFPR